MPISSNFPQTIKVQCRKCGKEQIISSGLHVPLRQKQFEILIKIGWDVMPKILCRICACPLSEIELAVWDSIVDYKEAQNFVFRMKAKYGDKVKKFFTTE